MTAVSVVIPCYRQAHWLPDALDAAQPSVQGVDTEIVVIDDGSPDEVAEVAARYPQVKLVRQDNAGLSAARNAGVLATRAPYLLFLDSDDALRPNALAAAVAALEMNPEIDVVHGLADVVVGSDPEITTVYGGADLSEDTLHRLLHKNIGPPNTFVVRRTTLSRSGLFDPNLRSCEDWDLWLRIAAAGGRFLFVPQMRGVYRISPGSMSQNLERMWISGREVLVRNAGWHSGCRDCRTATRTGRRQFGRGLWVLTREGLRARASRRRTMLTLSRHPELAWHQIRGRFT